ncbi:MAG: hypothetical protein CM15mV42_1420 [uncultured marine virus]|nr:MAG: hypothetical protein CM15mV42_1420 [uncultured marine virus]
MAYVSIPDITIPCAGKGTIGGIQALQASSQGTVGPLQGDSYLVQVDPECNAFVQVPVPTIACASPGTPGTIGIAAATNETSQVSAKGTNYAVEINAETCQAYVKVPDPLALACANTADIGWYKSWCCK